MSVNKRWGDYGLALHLGDVGTAGDGHCPRESATRARKNCSESVVKPGGGGGGGGHSCRRRRQKDDRGREIAGGDSESRKGKEWLRERNGQKHPRNLRQITKMKTENTRIRDIGGSMVRYPNNKREISQLSSTIQIKLERKMQKWEGELK